MSLNMGMDVEDFYKNFQVAIQEELTSTFKQAVRKIKPKLFQFIEEQIKSTPEYESIVGGQLQAELGIKNPKTVMNAVIKQIFDSARLDIDQVKVVGSEISGGITLSILPGGYADLLSLPESSYMSNEHKIDWLSWLLLRGGSILVVEYRVLSPLDSRQKKYSRTKKAIMTKKYGGMWKVPAAFSGTEHDNFLIRAFSSKQVEQRLNELFSEVFS